MAIAKILPIPKKVKEGEKSVAASLMAKGYNRQPGAIVRQMPDRLPDGRYVTGMDENAPDVLSIVDDKTREAEQERRIATRKRLELATGINLSPKSEFYSKMMQGDRDGKYTNKEGISITVAQMQKLKDGENIFNFKNPMEEINFLWVSQLKNLIAPSLEDWKKGKCKPSCQFYVCDPEKENKILYDEKRETNKSIVSLTNASLDKRKQVARLLGLPVSESDKEETVYNILDTFIKQGEVKAGEYKGQRAVMLFNQMMDLKDNMLSIKDLVKQALTLGVYRKKNRRIYEGETEVAEDEDALLKHLASSKNQEDLIALEIKVNDKKKVQN